MDVSISDVTKAEKFAHEQRIAGLVFLQADESLPVTDDERSMHYHQMRCCTVCRKWFRIVHWAANICDACWDRATKKPE